MIMIIYLNPISIISPGPRLFNEWLHTSNFHSQICPMRQNITLTKDVP